MADAKSFWRYIGTGKQAVCSIAHFHQANIISQKPHTWSGTSNMTNKDDPEHIDLWEKRCHQTLERGIVHEWVVGAVP